MNNQDHPVLDRFRLLLIPSLLMGIFTNMYISGVIIYSGSYLILLSPFIGTLLFLLFHFWLTSNKFSTKTIYYLGAYVVVAEVAIHTHFFGWESGFIYFLLLLPVVLLLNFDITLLETTLFNLSILLAFVYLRFFDAASQTPTVISEIVAERLNYFNGTLTGAVFIVILMYFSRTIYKNDRMLLDVIADLELSNREIGKQHEQQKVLLKEIHHRVKNNLQIISSLMSLQSRNVESEEVIDVLNESRQRVEAIALIHQKLYQDDKGNKVDFKSYLEEFIQTHRTINPRIKFSLNSDEITLHLDCAVPLGLIISEMFTNAIKHAFVGIEQPELCVNVTLLGRDVELWMHDNGIGLPEPFDMRSENLGLGTDIIISLTEQIEAKIHFYNDNGANFKINFRSQLPD